MKKCYKIITISALFIFLSILLSLTSLSAQSLYYPTTFGTTSLSHIGVYPFLTDYSFTSSYYPSYGYPYLRGISPYTGTLGFPSGIGGTTDYLNIMKTIQYYQYLSYAYNFYQIARTTPMFYLNDIVADYIGSSLYSYVQNVGLSPQDAIITFIQQNLL